MGYQMFVGWRSSTLSWCDIYNNSDTQLVEYSDVPLYGDFSGSGNHFYGYKSAVFIDGEGGLSTNFEFFLIFRQSTSISWYANGSHTDVAYDNGNGYFCLNKGSTLANRQIVDITHIESLPVFRDRQEWLNYVQTPYTPPYTWQSVPSISGKNGILLLSTIQSVYLNNGDPVNNALESYIDFIDDSKVAVLVEQEIDDLTKVTVKYVVPAGTYEYIKLVYKVGSAPTSVTDGTAIDILQAAKKVILSGIADGSTYFFKIFTDITESEPYEFTTVRPMGDNLFVVDFNSDGRDIMRYNPNKIITVGYWYYSELRPLFSAALGALTDANHPSQPTYTISNGELTTTNGTQVLAWAYDVTANQRIIPANCTLWFEFDAYFLNSEGYLDWRMYNNQSNEVIYWCWDTKYNFSSGIWYNCQLKASVVNGIINRIEYYIDHTMVDTETKNIHMLCIDENNPVPLYYITFTTTQPTKLKNMKIYWE